MRSVALVFLLVLFPIVAVPQTDRGPMEPVTAFVTALTMADIDGLLAAFEDDATVFMPMTSAPKRLEGKAAIREVFAASFAQLRASDRKPPYFRLEPRDIHTQLFGDLAVITFHLGALPADDATSAASFSRRTFIVKRTGDRWRIAHLHASNMTLEPKKK